MRPTAFLVVCLFALPVVLAAGPTGETWDVSDTVQVTALAVADTANGFVGVTSTVQAQVVADGSGQVFVDTKPLSETDMQASARLAARVAADTLGLRWNEYDYLLVMRSDSTVIGGPSAGGIITLAFTTALQHLTQPERPWTLDPTVAATGTINPDGTIGPVGGIPEKAEGAARAGIRTVLFPAGQETAVAQEPGPLGVRSVPVSMADHCAELGITCRPATTVRDLIEAAAGVRLEVPQVEVPSTADYTQLRPSVTDQVERLRSRIGAVADSRDAATLTRSDRATVDDLLDDARARLAEADDALADEHYYLAATYAFRGLISVGQADRLVPFFAQGRDGDLVAEGVAACQDAADASLEATGHLEAHSTTEWLAYGAAQERALMAEQLADQARQRYENAVRYADWVDALGDVAFCIERADTATWWAGLADLFDDTGDAQQEDADAFVAEHLDRAREAVTYAAAVTGSAGVAQARLDEAMQARKNGHLPAAVALAVEAETQAALALQTVSGDVPQDVLDAAQQNAARAVDQARSAGIEPVVSVSLLELAESQQDSGDRLGSYWEARNLALLAPGEATAPIQTHLPVQPDGPDGYGAGALRAALAMGGILGAFVTLLGVMGWGLLRH